MTDMVVGWWPLGALAFSFCGALIVGFNQWAQLPGAQLVRWRVLGVWPLALASLLVLPWPNHVGFYATAAAMGVGLALADTWLFNAARVHGARLTALYIPMKMLVALGLWLVVAPESVWPLLVEPWRVPVLLVGLAVCSGAMLFIRRTDASWVALLAVVPVAMLLALGDVVAKLALPLPHGGWLAVVGSAVAFISVTTTVGAVASHWLLPPEERAWAWPTRVVALKAAGFGALLLMSLSLLLVVLAAAPNPGYVAAITMLSAVWLAVWARVRQGEQNNLWAGLALVFGAMCVAVAGH